MRKPLTAIEASSTGYDFKGPFDDESLGSLSIPNGIGEFAPGLESQLKGVIQRLVDRGYPLLEIMRTTVVERDAAMAQYLRTTLDIMAKEAGLFEELA